MFSFWLMPWQLQASALAFYLGMIFPAHFPSSPERWTALNVCPLYLSPPRHMGWGFCAIAQHCINQKCLLFDLHSEHQVYFKKGLTLANREGTPHTTQQSFVGIHRELSCCDWGNSVAYQTEPDEISSFLYMAAWLASWAGVHGAPPFLHLKKRFSCSTFKTLLCLSSVLKTRWISYGHRSTQINSLGKLHTTSCPSESCSTLFASYIIQWPSSQKHPSHKFLPSCSSHG